MNNSQLGKICLVSDLSIYDQNNKINKLFAIDPDWHLFVNYQLLYLSCYFLVS
jgi:hypothetical protein